MTNKTLSPIRGTRDVFGYDLKLHLEIVNTARDLANLYCYQELLLPIFENSSVFHRTLGETSDILTKETYTFLDRDKTSITLRPEFTAGVARALISNGLTQNLPAKFFSTGPVFRHERPQSCRYRQFHQLNFEFFGPNDAKADIEMIMLGIDLLKRLKLKKHATLEINSIGDVESRFNYSQALTQYLELHRTSLSENSLQKLNKNPLRILDSKDAQDQAVLIDAPKISNYFTAESEKYFHNLLQLLESFKIEYQINTKLVRGLDYYTHTVFEFTTQTLGAQGTIIAGGRYNGLVTLMGGPNVCAVGFAAGVERLAELIKKDQEHCKEHSSQIHLVPIGEEAETHALLLGNNLRNSGLSVYIEYGATLKKRMQQANKLSGSIAIIFGSEELKQSTYQVKDLLSGDQHLVPEHELLSNLRRVLNAQTLNISKPI